MVQIDVRGGPGRSKGGPGGPGAAQPPKIDEMALDLVCGVDFWCKLRFRGSPGDLKGSRGSVWA